MRYLEFHTKLLEAQNYEQMFAPLRKIAFTDSVLKASFAGLSNVVNGARKTLKRNDRIVWYLRWYRLFALRRATAESDPDVNRVIMEMFNRYMNEFTRQAGLSIDQVRTGITGDQLRLEPFEHFLSLPTPAIQNYQFGFQLPKIVLADFTKAEKAWQEETAGSFAASAVTGAEVVIQFSNNLAWYLLDAAYCPLEAKAMGHCGNQPRSYSSDKILSLRQTIKRQGHEFLKPYLTFILMDNGSLSEMKGRFNKSPKNAFAAGYSPSDFHNEIIALLKLPMITGITGGGYMPQENFKVSDLPKEQADALTEMKPSLLTVLEQYHRFGMTEELGTRISSTAAEAGRTISYEADQKAFEVEQFDSLKEFAKDFVETERDRTQPVICWVLDVLDGNENLEYYDGGGDDSQKQDILNEVKKKQPKYFAALQAHVEAKYRVENDMEDDDELDESLLDMINELDDEVESSLTRACYDAMERGAENEMYEAAERWMNDLKAVGGDFWLVFSSDHWSDSKITLMLSVPKVIEWMENDNFDSYPKDAIEVQDVNEPYYGFSGFDEGSGAERFIEDLGNDSDIFDSIRQAGDPVTTARMMRGLDSSVSDSRNPAAEDVQAPHES